MEHYRTYKIDVTHIIWGTKKTIELAESKDEAKQMLKRALKNFSILWRKSVIYC